MKKFFHFASLLFITGGLCAYPAVLSAQNTLRAPRESAAVAEEAVIGQFYRQKAQRVLRAASTYRDKYNALIFAVYPRVLWSDVIDGYAPYDQKGALFTRRLQAVYAALHQAPAPDTAALAREALAAILGGTANASAPQGPAHMQAQAMFLASFYVQLGDFAAEIAKQKSAAQADLSSVSAYLDENVFLRRRAEITAFVRAYAALADRLVKSTLVPLQTSYIEKADVHAYLRGRLAGTQNGLLLDVLLQDIPKAEVFYKQAEEINPSVVEQLRSCARLALHPAGSSGRDVCRALSMFEYISPGVLIETLNKYGAVPSRAQTLDALAGALAAQALNQKLMQAAADLFEFEKPFYYSHFSFGGAEDDIGRSWHAVASGPWNLDGPIARVAADNLLRSGIRTHQDDVLSYGIERRRAKENALFQAQMIAAGTDLAAGDIVFKLAAPLAKTAMAGIFIPKINLADDLSREVSAAQRVAKTAAAPHINLGEIKSFTHLSTSEDYIHRAVWWLQDAGGEARAVLKYGTEAELEKTKLLDHIVRRTGLRKRLRHIELEYPQVLAEDLGVLPAQVRAGLEGEISQARGLVRQAQSRMEHPFILSRVDDQGVTWRNCELPQEAFEKLGGRAISAQEWKEVEKVYKTLNDNGFVHQDIFSNLILGRTPQGKLKVTLLDFEPQRFAPSPSGDANRIKFFGQRLRELDLRAP